MRNSDSVFDSAENTNMVEQIMELLGDKITQEQAQELVSNRNLYYSIMMMEADHRQ